MHLQKGLVYLYTKKFLPLLLHFWNYNLSPNGQIISLIGAQAHPQAQPLRDEWYKVLRIIHCKNISNRINLRRSQASILYIRFPVFLCWAMHHVSMYFLGKAVFHFLPNEKTSCFWEKNTIFPDDTRKIICRHGPFWKDHLFRRCEENIIFPCIFLRKIIFNFPCKV